MCFIVVIVFFMFFVLLIIVVDWKFDYKVVCFGVLFGENEKDCVVCYKFFEVYFEKIFGIDVEFFIVGNYDGVVQVFVVD